jgi:hypothetical protein
MQNLDFKKTKDMEVEGNIWEAGGGIMGELNMPKVHSVPVCKCHNELIILCNKLH